MIRVYAGGTLLSGVRSVMQCMGRLILSPQFDPMLEKYGVEGGWVCKTDTNDRLCIRMKTATTRFYDPADETATDEAAFLRATDVLVWVLDSQRARVDANRQSLEKIWTSLTRLGKEPSAVPAVMVSNKRDLDDLLTVAEIEQLIRWPRFKQVTMVAPTGQGVEQVVIALMEMVKYARSTKVSI